MPSRRLRLHEMLPASLDRPAPLLNAPPPFWYNRCGLNRLCERLLRPREEQGRCRGDVAVVSRTRAPEMVL